MEVLGDQDLVTIVMPAHQVAGFVGEAVRSVHDQTWPNIELLAVDDGSADGTGEQLVRLASAWTRPGRRMAVLRQANRGAAAARNAGLAQAKGTYIGFCDADDRWDPTLLADLMPRLLNDPGLDLVFPRVRHVDEAGGTLGIVSRPSKHPLSVAGLILDNPIHTASGVLVRRAALLRAGGFDRRQSAAIDLDCWIRVAALRQRNIGCSPSVLVDYRRRRGQITAEWRRMQRSWLRMAVKAAALAPEQVRPIIREAHGRQLLYWSTLAYQNGDYSAARQLIAEAWRRAPASFVRSPHFWVRTAACGASFLPGALHDRLARGFNGIRLRLGFDLS